MKLSRKAWNNVLIYASLAMILILNLGNDTLFNKDEDNSEHIALVPANDAIIALNFNEQLYIERQSTTWISKPEVSLTQQKLTAIVDAWQQTLAMPIAQAPDFGEQQGLKVTLHLAKQAQPMVITVFPTHEGSYIHIEGNERWLGIAQEATNQLLPSEIWVSQ